MKETVKINLNQQLFDLDSDAYHKLREYLDALHTIFSKSPDEADEILQDIEQRIAEILSEKLSTVKQVVTLPDVEEVIGLLGTAEDFAMENDTIEDHSATSGENRKKTSFDDGARTQRKFFRDIDNNVLGGVCSGLGAYFAIDPVWIRIGLLLLFFLHGFGLLVYLILWAVVPAARTTAQKLQMRGRQVNIDNIQDFVKTEFSKVKDNWRNYSKSDGYQRTQQTAADVFSTLGNLFVVIAKIILILITAGFVVGMVVLVAALFSGIGAVDFFGNHHWHNFHFFHDVYPAIQNNTLFVLALVLVIVIPIIVIFTTLLKFILNIKTRTPVLSAFAWTFWALSIVYVAIVLISDEELFAFRYKTSSEAVINITKDQMLYIEVEGNTHVRNQISHYHVFGKDILYDKYDELCYVKPEVTIEPTSRPEPYMIIEQTAVIPGFEDDYSDEFGYDWSLRDSILVLNEFFTLDEDEIWQWPGMRIILFLPEGQRLKLSRDVVALFAKNDANKFFGDSYLNAEYTMEKDRIVPRREE
jgi:phage shock protein PspC (stress-responsive transcriptional regulator)